MKQMLFDLYNELEVTKSEALAIANMIDNGKLNLETYYDGGNGCCWFGLISTAKKYYFMPDSYIALSFSDKYKDLENYEGPEAAQWVREYAEQC